MVFYYDSVRGRLSYLVDLYCMQVPGGMVVDVKVVKVYAKQLANALDGMDNMNDITLEWPGAAANPRTMQTFEDLRDQMKVSWIERI